MKNIIELHKKGYGVHGISTTLTIATEEVQKFVNEYERLKADKTSMEAGTFVIGQNVVKTEEGESVESIYFDVEKDKYKDCLTSEVFDEKELKEIMKEL